MYTATVEGWVDGDSQTIELRYDVEIETRPYGIKSINVNITEINGESTDGWTVECPPFADEMMDFLNATVNTKDRTITF